MANEAYFIRQRSLLHLPSKPVAFLIQKDTDAREWVVLHKNIVPNR